MNRWHAESCNDPEVILLDGIGTPYCRRCDRSPDLDALRNALPSGANDPVIPSDKPLGELNLYWPPTVPYSHGKETSSAEMSQISGNWSSQEKKPPLGEELSIATNPTKTEFSSESTQAATSSGVYKRRLASDEFRLLILAASSPSFQNSTPSTPVHVELEIHNDERYPEYETVSYTWGGETGDSSPCRPVFVGDYWDIVFQTRNCEAMLRSLRPERGIRLLWVDALCINQSDTTEREQQVGKMGSIYGNAIRVIVFLGPHVSPSQVNGPAQQYPARRKLEDLCDLAHANNNESRSEDEQNRKWSSEYLELRDVLQMRYFSRIWVVQELLLSRYAVIRIGNMEFIADHLTGKKLDNQKVTSWVLQIAQGRLSMDSFGLFQLVSRCRASDPRDMVFGILGLLSTWEKIPADYSLSMKEVSLGFLGHCLAREKNPDVLLLRHLGSRHPGYPSWAVPIHHLDAILDSEARECVKCNHKLDQKLGMYMRDLRGSRDISLRTLEPRQLYTWPSGTDIDGGFGVLTINLLHLLKIQRCHWLGAGCHQKILLWPAGHDDDLARIPDWAISLTLKGGVPDGCELRGDHLFLSPTGMGHAFILREIPEKRLAFRLLTGCFDVKIHNLSEDTEKSRDFFAGWPRHNYVADLMRESSLVGTIKLANAWHSRKTKEFDEERHGYLCEKLSRAKAPSNLLDDPWVAWNSNLVTIGFQSLQNSLSLLFSKAGVLLRSLIYLCQAMLNDQVSVSPGFAEEYLECLQQSGLQATAKRVNGKTYIELCFGSGDEAEARHFLPTAAFRNSSGSLYRLGPFKYWRVSAGDDNEQLNGDREPEESTYKEAMTEMQDQMHECVSRGSGSARQFNSSKASRSFYLAANLNDIKSKLQGANIDNQRYEDGDERRFPSQFFWINLWDEVKKFNFDRRNWININTTVPSNAATMLFEGTEWLESMKDTMMPAVFEWPEDLMDALGIDGSTYRVQII